MGEEGGYLRDPESEGSGQHRPVFHFCKYPLCMDGSCHDSREALPSPACLRHPGMWSLPDSHQSLLCCAASSRTALRLLESPPMNHQMFLPSTPEPTEGTSSEHRPLPPPAVARPTLSSLEAASGCLFERAGSVVSLHPLGASWPLTKKQPKTTTEGASHSRRLSAFGEAGLSEGPGLCLLSPHPCLHLHRILSLCIHVTIILL